jgi:Ser/Thr protein kinase RdoA (MazF antagonist)
LGRAHRAVDTEYDLLRHLQAFGVPVAVPILPDSRRLCMRDGHGVYLLYPMLPADHTIPPDGVDQVYANIGAAVARLHVALAAYPGQVDSWTMDLPRTLSEEAIPRIQRVQTGHDADAFQRVVAEVQDEMTAALADLPTQLIHGDCHGGNYLLYRGDVSGFVDLDHLPTGPRAYDIGYLLADMAKAQFVDIHAHRGWLQHFQHVVIGYQREIRLSRREKDALWFVMLATQVLFVDWFFQHGRSELALKNLEAFYWIHRNGHEIARRIACV